MKIQRALISVSQKEGIETFAKLLHTFDVEIISSGGTARFLQEKGIAVTPVSVVTEFPEILNGRVKTLHPRISGGILALRDNPEHMMQLQEYGIKPIDMVVVNLYPFLEALRENDKSLSEMLEFIDIGGPTLIRAAAKNYPHVTVITSSAQLGEVAGEMQRHHGEISSSLRQKLAREAFRHTAYYDAVIAEYFSQLTGPDEPLPKRLVLPLQETAKLRYGENPHQKAGFYQASTAARIQGIEQLQGIELSYNNLLDVDAALRAVENFDRPTVVIVKHTNPCGVGSDEDLAIAYEKARATDPISAFGGILGVNRPLTMALAEKLRTHFLEVLLAPDYSEEARVLLQRKKKLRILRYLPKRHNGEQWYCRSVLNGFLIQEMDTMNWDKDHFQVVTKRQPTEEEWQALAFTWRVVKHVKSNAIVFGRGDRTLGIGAGQMSRVDAVELAVRKAQKVGLSLHHSVLASDAFFPFRDGVDAAAAAGATAIVQPGGSIRDEEVITAADEHDLAMIFTRMRHFRH